ncbi:MAG: RecB family exonuclease [Candidatus Woesearchaeota archaeon]
MGYFSYSKINTFFNCKYQYKLRYIDRVKVDYKTSVEGFMGSLVHKTIERLHKTLKNKKTLIPKPLLIQHYNQKWDLRWTDDILIVKDKPMSYYKKKGEKIISNYYDEFQPFNKYKTLDLETKDYLKLDKDNYSVRIDRLAKDENDKFYVIDFKTSSRLPSDEDIDNDTQLSMYSLHIINKYNLDEINLIWRMLSFNKSLKLKRTKNELLKIKNDIENKIKVIKKEKRFEPNVSKLCHWCSYQDRCNAFNQ